MAYVISSISMKGGVGKTTSVLCLGTGLADRGKKVLLLDLDAQGNLSIAMGCAYPDQLPVTMADIFQKMKDTQSDGNITEGILSVSEYLNYLPANRKMALVGQELAMTGGGEQFLKRFLSLLSAYGKEYDYILLDGPPSLGMVTVNALVASEGVLISTQAEYLAAKGMEQSETTEVELSLIDAFPEHPFRVQADEDMERLIASIRESGVLVPVILRRGTDGRYQTIAGHRRCFACRQLDLERILAVIKDVTDEEAVVWMVDSNIQRTGILPSEKAKAYRMKMDALAKQGRRTDLMMEENASRQTVGRWQKETAEKVGMDSGDSGRKVQRYLRLNHLHPGLLEKVDEKKMPFLSGVELSYLRAEQQEKVFRYLTEHPCSVAVAQAKRLRELGEDTRFSQSLIAQVLQKKTEEKGKLQKDSEKEPFSKYFPSHYSREKRRSIVEALLKKWKKGEIQL